MSECPTKHHNHVTAVLKILGEFVNIGINPRINI